MSKRARNREVQVADDHSGTAFINRIPDDNTLEAKWEEQWRRAVYRQCMVKIRAQFDGKTVEAFELSTRGELPVDEVANRLGTTTNAVYLARHRILKRVREMVPAMEKIW